jgi:integrase
MARYTDVLGKRRTIYGDSHDAAHRKLIAAQQSTYEGTVVPLDNLTVETYLQEWLQSVKSNLRFRTWKRYRELTEIHLIPEIGKIRLARLHPRDLRLAYTNRQKYVSSSTVGHAHRVLHIALAQAARDDLVTRNVASLVKAPRVERAEPPVYSEEELTRIIEAAVGHRFEAVWSLAISTAARAGEIFGATWKNLDLDDGIWRIETSLQRSPNGLALVPPKTERGRRTVRIGEVVAAKLTHARALQAEEKLSLGPLHDNPMDLVFARTDGRPMDSPAFLRRYHYPLLKQAGIRKLGLHALRHSAISVMLAKGVPVPEVSALAGHANPAVTMGIYAHALPNTGGRAIEAMQSVVGG